jgi:hypothetical protein
VYDSYETTSPWRLYGGTSVATPIIASAMALATPYTRSLDGAQALYLEAAANGTGALDDVLSGSNGSCGSYLCEAGPGYDGPTGLGTPHGAPELSPSQVHPPTVVTEAASSVAQTSATLNATVNPNGGRVTHCYFAGVGVSLLLPCAALPGSGEAPVAVSATLQGLLPSSSYGYRIVATNPSGTSSGAAQAFTTLSPPLAQLPPPAPPPQPQAISNVQLPQSVPALIASTSVRSSASGVVGVKVICPTAYPVCAGSITLRTLRAVDVGGHGEKRVLVLASGPFKLAGGHSAIVRLRLATKARALLRHAHQLRARASIAFAAATGALHSRQAILTIRAPAPVVRRP